MTNSSNDIRKSHFSGLANAFLGLTCFLSGIFAALAGLVGLGLLWIQTEVIREGSYEGGLPILAVFGFVAGAKAIGLLVLCVICVLLLLTRLGISWFGRRTQ